MEEERKRQKRRWWIVAADARFIENVASNKVGSKTEGQPIFLTALPAS